MLFSGVYDKVVNPEIISEMISQGIITVLSSLVILFFQNKKDDIIKPVIIIALVNYFFYG